MIFDPSLATATRSHVRAQAESQKASLSAGPTNSSPTGTSSITKITKFSPKSNHGTEESASAAAAASAYASAALRGTAEKVVESGEQAAPVTSSIWDGVGGGDAHALSLTRTSSGPTNEVDSEVARVECFRGQRVSQRRRRVLLKIVVLERSNISPCFWR